MSARAFTPVAVAAVVCSLCLGASGAAAQVFTDSVTLSFKSDQVTYQGPLHTAYLMLDVDGGRNRVSNARAMTCDQQNPVTCSITLDLEEGDYIYVFVANPDSFVDLADPNLNPDDIPDSNFFRDPNPPNPGFCGQFSTDNCLFVRNPNRPTFDAASFEPGHGALVTSSPVTLRIAVNKGANGAALNAGSARAYYEDEEPPYLRYSPSGQSTSPTLVEIDDVTFTANASGGVLEATVPSLPEGFHRVMFDVASGDGLEADRYITSVLVNEDNQTPTASAGPTKFATAGQEVQLDATWSTDPDFIGFQTYTWTVLEAPGGGVGSFRCVDEEILPRDGFGKPLLDAHGLSQGSDCGRPAGDYGAVPRFSANVPGRYVLGLTVKDYGPNGGITSAQSTTEVHVNDAWNLGIRPRIEVAIDGNTITLDGSLTPNSSGSGVFVADAMNPAAVALDTNGLRSTFTKPSTPGAYVFHFTVDNAYPATAMVRVHDDGSVDGFDLARPPEDWKTEKVLYLGYVRELYDSDGDGEGDLLGMIDKMAHLSDLGVNAMWLMPLSPGPTTHGYAATGFYGVEEDYGTAADVELLAETAKAFGIELLMDLVANHSSDQHPFFQAARQNPDSPLRDWYAFDADGSYRYAFTFVALPDQDQNNPLVRQGIMQVVDWFFDRGFDGIRCDIAGFTPPGFWQMLRRHVKARNPDSIMLAELIPPMGEFFDDGFDLAYDSTAFWSLRDAFAAGGSLDALDNALEGATHFVENAYSERVRQSVRQEDVLFMRYIDNQDEDRFLLRAAGDMRKARAVASVLLTLPGTPLITYGNEVGIKELRGRYPFSLLDPTTNLFPSEIEGLRSHYRKLLLVRKGNRALRMPDNAPELLPGNSYVRVSSGFDEGGGNVYSYVRHGDGQRFLVLSNRADSTALGTRARVYPPPSLFEEFPDGNLILVDHLDPSVQLNVTKAQLLEAGGFVVNVPGFGSRVLQVTRFGLPDGDADTVLDSYDNCVGVSNATQRDLDADGVGDRCDLCAGTVGGTPVARDGCPVSSSDVSSRARYVLDGVVDATAYEHASGTGITLWASFNGKQLYVATEAADRGEDTFIVVTDNTGRVAVAPFGKAGTVPTDGIFLADEGENDFTKWFGITGEGVAHTEPLPGRGVLEGTLNLVELFGDVPEEIYLAAVRYEGGDAGALIAQAPAGNGDNVVDASEMITLDLTQDPLPVVDAGPDGPGPGTDGGSGPPPAVPGDADGDGVEELIDNCQGVYNASQSDADQDGLGDACDQCPLTAPGVVVDADGCGDRQSSDDTDFGDRSSPRLTDEKGDDFQQSECGCAQAGTPRTAPFGLVALLVLAHLGLVRRRRPS